MRLIDENFMMGIEDSKDYGGLSRSYIKKIKERFHLGTSKIAKKIGVSYSCLNRIEKGESKSSLVTTLRLLSLSGESKQATEILKRAEELKRAEGDIFYKMNSTKRREAEEYLNDPHTQEVTRFIVDGPKGRTRGEVKNEYGVQGIKILDEFIKMDIVTKSSS